MALEVKIPPVGESITTGTIAQWHKKDGETVAAGDLILTLETDKVSSEIEAEGAGILRHKAAEGEEVEIGAIVAVIEEDATSPAATAANVSASDAATRKSAPADSVSVAPTVRKFAGEHGVDLTTIEGTGKRGFITKADVQAAIASPAAAAARTPGKAADTSASATGPELSVVSSGQSAPPAALSERITRTKLSPLRRKIATHLVSAQQSAAILSTFNECDMSAVMRLRKEVQDSFQARHGIKLGFMSFFIKAVVDALKTVPQINARLDGDELLQQHYYDIGVAVGTEKGLIVPVIRDCDRKSFADIEKSIADFAARARESRIAFEDLQGGVFTISNGGIYGSLLSTPILNPPQSGILGMHTIQQRPVAIDSEIVIRPMMYLALSYDHRVVDGKEAVTFLIRVKQCIEDPTRLLVDA